MDKIFAKQILESEGIRNVPFVYFSKNEFENSESKVLSKIKKLGFPVIVKPANLGSSVAIEVARTKEEFLEATKIALEFDDRILVERFLEGAEEYNCAVFEFDKNVKTSKVVKVDKGEIFSFEKCQIPVGAELEYVNDKTIKCYVVDDRRIKYNDEVMYTTTLAKMLLGKNSGVNGPTFFTYKGKNLADYYAEFQYRKD